MGQTGNRFRDLKFSKIVTSIAAGNKMAEPVIVDVLLTDFNQ